MPQDEKFPSAQAWRTCMNTEQRQVDRQDLAQVSAKVNYSRNPRFLPPALSGNQAIVKSSKRRPKEINILPKPESEYVLGYSTQ